jgi:transposase
MPPPYSMALRSRALADCDRGLSAAAVAAKFAVSPARVYRLLQRRRQTGEARPRRGRPGPAPELAGRHERLRQIARAEPDLSAEEYRDRLGAAGPAVTVWRCPRRLGLTVKKK